MRRKIPVWLFLLSFWVFAVLLVTFGSAVYYIDHGGRLPIFNKVTISVATFPFLVGRSIDQIKYPNHLLYQGQFPDLNGFAVTDTKFVDDGYLLLSYFDKKYNQGVVELMRIRDSGTIHKWVPDMDSICKYWDNNNEDARIKNIDNHTFSMGNPLLLNDGSVIFCNMGPLLSIDSHANIKWVLKGYYHHSLNIDGDGNIWVPFGIMHSPAKNLLMAGIRNDALVKITPQGKVLLTISVAEILLENGYRGLLFGTGPNEYDAMHLNDIQPALTTGKYWQKGDLLVSLRHKSTVFLYRPSTNKIIWLKTGPWLQQHDPDFVDSTRVSVFGNNITRDINDSSKLVDGHNEVYIYDFSTGAVNTPFTRLLEKEKVGTIKEGLADVLANGDIFVEETLRGRLLRGDSANPRWIFVKRNDPGSISRLNWCRYISKEEYIKCFSKIKFDHSIN